MHTFTGYTNTRFTLQSLGSLGNEFSSMNSDDKQRVVNQGNEWTQQMWVKVQKLHTYIQAYMMYTIIYPWFFVLSLVVSRSLPIIVYIITTVELCMYVCVFVWLLTSFSYSTTALHFITWCQEWFSLRLLLAVLTSRMMFQPSWLEAVVLVAGPIGFLPNHSYMVLFYLV